MKGIKFYSGVNFDGSELFLGAVLNGVAVVSAYPVTHVLDLDKVANDIHKHVIESAIGQLVPLKSGVSYRAIRTIADSVGMKGMLSWNDVPATEDYFDFRDSILAEYKK